MKFAFVLDGLSCGGVERVAVTYCNALVERGHSVTVINLLPAETEFKCELLPEVKYEEVLYSKKMAPERYCSLISRCAWGRFIYPVVYLILMIALLLRRPFLRRRFGDFDVAISFSGHYNDLTLVAFDCISAKKKVAWLHGSVNSYALISDGFVNLYRRFNKLICLSREGEQEFRSAKHWIDLPIVQLYNPIDLAIEDVGLDVSRGLEEKYGDYILTVARLAYPKDIRTLIKALEILKNKYEIEKQLVVVGDGPDSGQLVDFAKKSTVSDRVHFVGYTNDPSPYYESCNVFVLSSLSEGLPTVLLEAMSRGKPVVSTDTIGANEILQAGKYGILCGIGDAFSMARGIARICGDAHLSNQYVDAARTRVKDFEKNRIISGFLEIVTGDGLGES